MSQRRRSLRSPRLAIRELIASTEGATAVEYGLLAALVVLVLVGALVGLGDAIRDLPMAELIAAFASVLS